MSEELENKLKDLPTSPGVYFHKSKSGEIIYVGKAANLKSRVRQYFQKSKGHDPKTLALVDDIHDTDWMVVDSEIEALFLEAEMIRRYMPKYNILLRDDKSMVYLRIDYDSDYPTVSTTRRPLDDKARYFGPFLSVTALRQALKYLRRAFPYATKQFGNQKRASLYYHLGLDPGLEEGRTSLRDYRANLKKLMAVISGRKKQIEVELRKEMNKAAKKQDFESATKYRNQLLALESLDRQVIFSDKEFLDISKDHALNELVSLFNLAKIPRTIEAYDISHMQGSDVVASMVVFTNGVSDKRRYRKFKMHVNQNNDFFNMHETLSRRLKPNHLKTWGVPDLVLIDGGKGQLDAAIKARDENGQSHIPFLGLAKRQEQVVIQIGKSNVEINPSLLNKLGGFTSESQDFILVDLPHSTNLIKLLQRIRDESHRFAVSYHSVLKVKRQTASVLDNIPGVGPTTRRKLQKQIGGINAITKASEQELSEVVGKTRAHQIKQYLKN
ncbi:MAG: excinuclease ABC subunit UvrC [Candidatus Saccharibacteria bacterium]